MTGSIVKQSRVLPTRDLTFTQGLVGSPGSPGKIYPSAVPPSQTTVSFRTSRNEVVRTQMELDEDDLRTVRNGFTTYDPSTDKGHEFWTTRTSIETHCPNTYVLGRQSGGAMTFYRGPLVPKTDVSGSFSGGSFPVAPALSSSEIIRLGQQAINASAPTAPQANAAQAVLELFQDLPQIPGKALFRSGLRQIPSKGSDEFLNWEFGIAPLLSDLRKIVSSYQRQTAILRQLQRDNGRVVRRRFAFPASITNSESTFEGLYGPYLGTDSSIMKEYGTDPIVNKIRRTERSTWFSGAFSYFISVDSSLMAKLDQFSAKANVLMGARFDASLVWELTPWSWLLDWQSTIGRALKTASLLSSDNLVIRYGYLMSHVVIEDSYMVGPRKSTEGTPIPASHVVLRSERKERIRATPYGFGVDLKALTGTQIAILAALGMSKNRGTAV